MLGPILYEMSVAHRLRGSKSERKRERERKDECVKEREEKREKERETGSDRSINYLVVAPQPLPHSPDTFDASKCDGRYMYLLREE